jgi:LasA protease
MANKTQTRSNANYHPPSLRWVNGVIVAGMLISLTACTNDYVSIDPVVTTEPTATAQLLQTPTAAATLPQEMPTSIVITPVPVGPVGIGSGDALYNPTIIPEEDPLNPSDTQPTSQPTSMADLASSASNVPPTLYYTQAGDTLPGLAARFHVDLKDIIPATPVSQTGFLDPNQLMMIPKLVKNPSVNLKLMPDSEVVFSPSGLDFDIDGFVKNAGGYLSTYKEYLQSSGWLNGAGVIRKIAIENSINPRILLSMLEYRSHWVYGQPTNDIDRDYPMGHIDPTQKGLYFQLAWAVSQLNVGYYGWREGIVTDVKFADGTRIAGAPELNAGSFALQFLFAQLFDRSSWEAAMYTQDGFAALHTKMFGSPWLRAMAVEPLFPATLQQPPLILPFESGVEWDFTGGPHAAWGNESARAALDFAPNANGGGCSKSDDWVLAAASGMVVRTGGGVVVLDLDGDGVEQTGWDILYMHIATADRVKVGDFLEQGQRIGHPSCEGGVSTGTHTHIARKYNGEWILAGGPLPFDLDGWIAHAAADAYKGTLSLGDKIVTACACGSKDTIIMREISPTPTPVK